MFFGAGYCPATKSFLPTLIEFYNEVNTEQKLLEIVYVSYDRTEEEFKQFFK